MPLLTFWLLSTARASPSQPSPSETKAGVPVAVSAPVFTTTNGDRIGQVFDVAIPMVPIHGHGLFLIHLRLSGKVDANFAVDTGSNVGTISTSLVNRLGLTPHLLINPDGTPRLFQGKEGSAVTLDSIEFPGALVQGKMSRIGSEQIVVPDFPAELGIDGIIGTNLLAFFGSDFDFTSHTLTLYYPGNFSAPQAHLAGYLGVGDTSIPLTLPPGQPDYLRYYVTAILTSKGIIRQTSLAVDTGSEVTIISRPLAQDLRLKAAAKQHEAGMMGDFEANRSVAPSLGLGELTVKDAVVVYPDKGDYYPVLGLNVLSRYRVLLDFPGKTMYLAPTVTPVAVPLPAPAPAAPVPPK